MKRLLFLSPLLLLLCLAGCESPPLSGYVCNCDQRTAVAAFVAANIEAANNKSDEEMEDVIKQLQYSAVEIHCTQRTMRRITNDIRKDNGLDSCETFFHY